MQSASDVVKALTDILNDRLMTTLRALRGKPQDQWTMLPGFTFTGAELAAGDQLLKTVAKVIRASCRAQDLAARLGGDEFVVLLDGCPIANAEQVARKIVDAVAAIDFEWNCKHYSIGASVGVAPVGASSADEALARADAACYAAKASGRGRVVSASV